MAMRCRAAVTLLLLGCGLSAAQPPTGDGRAKEPLPETVNGKTLTQWAKQFEGKDVKERREAAKALGEFSKHPGDELVQRPNRVTGASEPVKAIDAFVETLAKALGDADWQVRRDTAHALGKLGVKAKGAEGALKKLAKDEDKDVQGAAAEALKRINPEGNGK